MNALFQPPVRTLADLLRRLGDIPADRVRFSPVPGTATLGDLLRPENEGCELVDGTLVEKRRMGLRESILAIWLGRLLHEFVSHRKLGTVTGEQGYIELTGGSIRGPDVAYFSWARLKDRRHLEPIPQLSPDLVVEILSESNRPGEMKRKYTDFFDAGVRRIWEIDPRARTVRVYSTLDEFLDRAGTDTLAGDPVLPGFSLPLKQLFEELDQHV